MKITRLLIFCAPFVFSGLAQCASSIYSGPFVQNPADSWPLDMMIVGNTITPTVSISAPLINSWMQISVDTGASTMTIDKIQFQTGSVTDVVSISKTVGFGLVRNFEISVTIDPINLSLVGAGTSLGLEAGDGGVFEIVNSFAGDYLVPENSPVLLTGSYTITGPTQMVSGTFNVPVAGTPTIVMPNVLEAINFPSSLNAAVYGSGLYRIFVTSRTPNAISQVVDGAQIDWDFDYVTFRIPERTVLTPGELVPEVSTSMLGVVALVFSFVSRRHRNY